MYSGAADSIRAAATISVMIDWYVTLRSRSISSSSGILFRSSSTLPGAEMTGFRAPGSAEWYLSYPPRPPPSAPRAPARWRSPRQAALEVDLPAVLERVLVLLPRHHVRVLLLCEAAARAALVHCRAGPGGHLNSVLERPEYDVAVIIRDHVTPLPRVSRVTFVVRNARCAARTRGRAAARAAGRRAFSPRCEAPLQDLAAGVGGQGPGEPELRGHLVLGQPLGAVRGEFLRRHPRALAHLHPGRTISLQCSSATPTAAHCTTSGCSARTDSISIG